jgi:hypothetical protein
MAMQTDNLVMAALGVVDDKPPKNSSQAKLVKGIHLRFAFAPERGFPWYGYYLFRRKHRASEPRCLSSKFKQEWKPGPWHNVRADFTGGVFSSDADLVFLDQFPPAGRSEFDLRGRKYLRFELPPGERAREFHVKLGMLGGGDPITAETNRALPQPTKKCVDFTELTPGLYPNPYVSAKVEFTALGGIESNPASNCEIRLINQTAGLIFPTQLRVRLPVRASSVEIALIQSAVSEDPVPRVAGNPLNIVFGIFSRLATTLFSIFRGPITPSTELIALDEQGNIVVRKTVFVSESSQTIKLSGGAIASVNIVALKDRAFVLRFCYTPEFPDPPMLGPIKLRAFDGQVPVTETTISGQAGEVVTAVLSADRMTSLEIESGPAALIDICTVAISQDLARDWTSLLKTPLCLPVEHAAYPCPGKPVTFKKAESLAKSRILYGLAADWVGEKFLDLNNILKDLVKDGPAGPLMSSGTKFCQATVPGPEVPDMPALRPLDVVLVASLHPAIAMILGQYFVDRTAELGATYDYLVMADHHGQYHGKTEAALAALAAVTPDAPLPDDVDVWVTFGKKLQDEAPLAPPAAPNVYALPGDATGSDAATPPKTAPNRCMAGLTWKIDAAPDGTLLPGGPIGYHLWRAFLGEKQPASPPPSSIYHRLTADRLIIATEIPVSNGTQRERASDWPPFPLMAFDPGLAEGWYSYGLSAVDIFGRHSVIGAPGAWRQWAWPQADPPAPKPWYYVDPPNERQVNPFAVRLLDKRPPPRPPGVEATALDPDDPMLLKDEAYDAWWTKIGRRWWGLSRPRRGAIDRNKVLALRVRWKWTLDQMLQAPNTKEFRIYFHPGTEAPASDPLDWQERIYVVGYKEYVKATKDAHGNPVLLEYEVLLPRVGGPRFPGVPLAPAETEPIVYAHIGVGAADNKSHTADDPKWSTGRWGKRSGNQGRLGTAKIYRVLRSTPPAPPAVDTSEKVWATRADYHSRSYYTFRWARNEKLKAHIFRALDDTLFQVDWERRKEGASPIDPTKVASFPIPWNQPTRNAIADELKALPVPGSSDSFDEAVRKAYEVLSNNALRTLAGLPGNEAAFSQITYEPLDPDKAENTDRAGPDGSDKYTPSEALRAYTAELDGRASNRYFFRAASVNGAHTIGALGPSSPPVYLPKVVPPPMPVIVKATGGHLSATLAWTTANAEAGGHYVLYRTDNDHRLRDVRLMDRVLAIPSTGVDPSTALAEWRDYGLLGGQTYHYCLVFTDADGNTSAPSKPVPVFVPDEAPPNRPSWTGQGWLIQDPNSNTLLAWPNDGIVPQGYRPVLRLKWESGAAGPSFVISRSEPDVIGWRFVAQGDGTAFADGGPNKFVSIDPEANPAADLQYRIKVSNAWGLWSRDYATFRIAPPDPLPNTP